MSRNREALCLSSRYIHTGNSGVTFTVNRDVKDVRRAEILVTNGAFGAFRTELQIRGNDHAGMTSAQLRDLALMFLDAAAELDAEAEARFEHESPSIVSNNGMRQGDLPNSLQVRIPDVNPLGGKRERKYDTKLTAFFDLLQKNRSSRNLAMGTSEGDGTLRKGIVAKNFTTLKAAEEAEEAKFRRSVDQSMLKAGFRYLAAKQVLDHAAYEFQEADTEMEASQNLYYGDRYRADINCFDTDGNPLPKPTPKRRQPNPDGSVVVETKRKPFFGGKNGS